MLLGLFLHLKLHFSESKANINDTGFPRVNEIQRNFKKIQRDIESKKSELRTMVGERYRELINTADTIAEMENTVKDIRTTLDSIQTSCKLGKNTFVLF